MPMVNVKITRDGASAEQKNQVIAEMTEVLAGGTGKKPGNHDCDYRRGGNRQLGYSRRIGFRTAQAGSLNIRGMRVGIAIA